MKIRLFKVFKNFLKLIKYISMLPLYWLSHIIPKDKNLWVFGAWFGERYADNSKYLFEYVNKNHPEIKVVWLTRNKNTYNFVRKKGYNVAKTFSLKGWYYALRAKVAVVSNGISDVNIFTTANTKVVQLWHGIPLKKIMFDDKITFKHPTIWKKFLFFIFPFLKKHIDYSNTLLIATSEEVQKIISSAFRVPIGQVKITGYPRNDSFFYKPKKDLKFTKKLLSFKYQGKKIAIYMPTHRKEGELDINKLFLSDLEVIDKKLKALNYILLIKLHFCHTKESLLLKEIKHYSNIIIINDNMIEQDIYNILRLTDLLITDYSSIYFDYLLLDKPMIFAPFDIETYIKSDREFYYNYDEVTPGPKAKNWNEVIKYMEETITYPDKYKEQRKKIIDRFHKYKDGNNCQRVFNEISKIIY